MNNPVDAAVNDAIAAEIAERLGVVRRVSSAFIRESLVLMDELDESTSGAEHSRLIALIDAMSNRCDQVSRVLEEIGEELRLIEAAA